MALLIFRIYILFIDLDDLLVEKNLYDVFLSTTEYYFYLYNFTCIYTWTETRVHGHCCIYHVLNAVEHFPQELAAAGLGDVLTGDLSSWLVCWQVQGHGENGWIC